MFATLQHRFQFWPTTARPPARVTLHPSRRAIQLEDKQFVSLADPQGWTVRALSGNVWVTQDWDRRDIVLEPGQSFMFERSGDALISAIGPARVCIAGAGGCHG